MSFFDILKLQKASFDVIYCQVVQMNKINRLKTYTR